MTTRSDDRFARVESFFTCELPMGMHFMLVLDKCCRSENIFFLVTTKPVKLHVSFVNVHQGIYEEIPKNQIHELCWGKADCS